MPLERRTYCLPVPTRVAVDENGKALVQRDRDGNVVLGRDGEPKPVLETVPGAPTRLARANDWNTWFEESEEGQG